MIAAVNGYAIGGGHVLHVICDLTIATDEALEGKTAFVENRKPDFRQFRR